MSVPEERQLEIVLESALGPAGRIAQALGRLGSAVQFGLTNVTINPELATDQSRASADQLIGTLTNISVVCAALASDIAARTGLPDQPAEGEVWGWEVRALGPRPKPSKKSSVNHIRARAMAPLETVEGKRVPVRELSQKFIDADIIPPKQFETGPEMEEVELIFFSDTIIKIGGQLVELPKDERYMLNVLLLFRDRVLTGPEIRAYDFLPRATHNARLTTFTKARRDLDNRLSLLAGKPVGSFVVKTEQRKYYLGYKVKVVIIANNVGRPVSQSLKVI